MSRSILFTFSLSALLFFTGNLHAQEKPETKISSIKQKGELVYFSLTSSRPFIYGSNKYYLYIGTKSFTRCEQWHKNGKGYIAFLLPINEYDKLQDGMDIYLTYGRVNIEDEDMNELSQNNRRCWSLGKLDKNVRETK